MEKKYNLIHQFRLETSVNVEGARVYVSFAGGSKFRGTRNGHFITSDPKLQKAIESDNGYGSQWILDTESEKRFNASTPVEIEPTNTEPPVVTTEPESTTEPITESGTTAEPTPELPTVDPEIAECTNYTLAKNYLVKYFDAKRPEIISEEKLREYAKSKGIIFPEFAK